MVHRQHDLMITAHTTGTITAQTAKTRIISTYIQQIWHGKIGQIHPILDQADLSFDTYMNCIRYRTMNIPAPVYIMPRSRHKIPYMERRCKFGCLDPADIFHVLLHCPHTTHHIHNTLYPPPTNPIDIFDDKTYDMRIVATVIHNLMTLLHAQSIDNHEQRTPLLFGVGNWRAPAAAFPRVDSPLRVAVRLCQ
jgi:hypothetical protein